MPRGGRRKNRGAHSRLSEVFPRWELGLVLMLEERQESWASKGCEGEGA